jgi:hypothetical protein
LIATPYAMRVMVDSKIIFRLRKLWMVA